MTVYNVKSTLITNRDSVPEVLTDALVSGGDMKESSGYVQTGSSADAATSTYRLCSVPSKARVTSVVLTTDALGTGAALDIGVYYPTFIPLGSGLSASSAAAVINTQLFGSAIAASSAITETNEIAQSGVVTLAKQELSLWNLAGLSSDPGIDLDICVNVQTAIELQGYIGLKVRYVL